MKIKKYIILLAVIIVAVAIFFLLQKSDSRETINKEPETKTEQLTQEQIKEETLKCEKEKAYFQANCFKELAIKAKDPSLCKRVSSVEDKGYETSTLFIHEGVCLALVAKELDYNLSICDQVKENEDQYSLCTGYTRQLHANKLKDPSVCEEIDHNDTWYANCLANSVDSEDDLKICDKVSNEGNKYLCQDQAWEVLAILKDKVEYCDKSVTTSNREICIGAYAKKYEKLDLCNTMDSEKNICICYNVYFDELNQNTCTTLSDQQKTNCEKCLNSDFFRGN